MFGHLKLLILGILVISVVVVAERIQSDDVVEELREINIFELRESPSGCPIAGVSGQCPAATPIYYFKCCGERRNNCCFRVQDWLLILLAIFIALLIVVIIVGLIRCICCF